MLLWVLCCSSYNPLANGGCNRAGSCGCSPGEGPWTAGCSSDGFPRIGCCSSCECPGRCCCSSATVLFCLEAKELLLGEAPGPLGRPQRRPGARPVIVRLQPDELLVAESSGAPWRRLLAANYAEKEQDHGGLSACPPEPHSDGRRPDVSARCRSDGLTGNLGIQDAVQDAVVAGPGIDAAPHTGELDLGRNRNS